MINLKRRLLHREHVSKINCSLTQQPLISVVTVVLNNVNLLEETILSIINQTYKNIEYLLIDGGSVDGTLKIIQKYEEEIDFWVSEPDKGIYDAMNKALKIAKGDFLIFMNSGDILYSDDTLSRFANSISNLDAIYYGNAIYKDRLNKENSLRGGIFNKYRLSKTNICHQTIFFSRKAYKSNFYNLKYNLFADWAYNIALFRKYNYKYIDQIIAYYDANGKSKFNKDLNFERDQKITILKNLGFDAILYLIANKLINLISDCFVSNTSR